MSEPLQTPPDGTQQQEQVQPDQPEDLNETEHLLADAQERIEQEAQEILEPGPSQPEPQNPPAPQPQEPEPSAPAITPATPQEPDYQEKFKQSSREAQNLIAKNNQAQARIDKLTNINITEDELRSLYPDWDSFNEVEKRAFRETAIANKKANQAMNIALDLAEKDAWKADFAKTLKANPALSGREEEFKAYCYKPAHKNVPIDVLVKSFLFDVQIENIPTPALPAPGLERGSGGPRDAGNGELSDEQLAQIRVSDPKRYRQILQSEIRRDRRK